MELERQEHEILEVRRVPTRSGEAIVKTHHTMYAHVELTAPAAVPADEEVTIAVRLAKWDDGATVTDYTPTLTVTVDGEAVDEVDPIGGMATVPLRFTGSGTHVVEVGCPTVRPATAEIVVE